MDRLGENKTSRTVNQDEVSSLNMDNGIIYPCRLNKEFKAKFPDGF